MIVVKPNRHVLAAVAVLCVFIAMEVKVSLAQVHSVQTYIAYYAGLSDQESGSLDGYSVLVNDPLRTTGLQKIFDAHKGLIVFHYLDMTELEPGRPWTDDVLEHHNDFLLKTIGGEFNKNLPFRIEYAWGFGKPYDSTGQYRDSYYIDPTSKGWAQYYTALADSFLVLENSQNREGIFADNVLPSICWKFANLPKNLQIDINGDGVMDGQDDVEWVNAMIDFSKRIRSRLGANVPLIGNLGMWWSYGNSGFKIFAASPFDGAMNEAFLHFSLTTDTSAYVSVEDWKANVYDMMVGDSLGKIVLCQATGIQNDTQARLFCLGSFLIGATEKSYYNYRFHYSYDTLYHFPEFSLPLGNPKETFTNVDQAFNASLGVYRRSFDSVEVFVNPFGYDVKFDLGTPRKVLTLIGGVTEKGGQLGWQTQQVFDMKPHSAVILSNE